MKSLLLSIIFLYITINCLNFNVRFKNDMIFMHSHQLFNVLEKGLIITQRSENYRFYSDLRYSIYEGSIFPKGDELKLHRVFIRYFINDFNITFGKIYVNQGLLGVFNPFETKKNIDMTDLYNEKEGILAMSLYFGLGQLSGLNFFCTFDEDLDDNVSGLELKLNVKRTDIGIISRFEYKDRKRTLGFFLNGDIIVGASFSLAKHFFYDGSSFHEANITLDHSFNGIFKIDASYYYNENGFERKDNYDYAYSNDFYFQARHYALIGLMISDMLFSFLRVNCFLNLTDGSYLLSPDITYQLSSNMRFSLIMMIPSEKDGEFSFSGSALIFRFNIDI